MGQDIQGTHFRHSDFVRFSELLRQETALLREWFATHHFSHRKAIGGLELEGWLISPDGLPQPANEAFLEHAADPNIVAELSKFNFELNPAPPSLAGNGLLFLENELDATWLACGRIAGALDLDTVSIGNLPTPSLPLRFRLAQFSRTYSRGRFCLRRTDSRHAPRARGL